MPIQKFNVAIIGAGPAGLAALGQLLDVTPALGHILWIDPSFTAGRLHYYPRVPSNTKVKLFKEYVKRSTSLLDLSQKESMLERIFDDFHPEKGCDLSHASEMVLNLSKLIQKHAGHRVSICRDRVEKLNWHSKSQCWTLTLKSSRDSFHSDFVIMATGSHPKSLATSASLSASPLDQVKEVPLDLALDPFKLAQCIQRTDRVAVVGSSHSAMLVLKNLYDLPIESRPTSIIQIVRSMRFKYAIDMPAENGKDAWILYDNTGLKGLVAEWTRKHVDVDHSQKEEDGNKADSSATTLEPPLIRHHESSLKDLKPGQDVTKVICAIGYDRNPLPILSLDAGQPIPEHQISYDSETAQLQIDETKKLPHLFGYGIAFPERVVDPMGNVESAVGLFKFAKYAKRTIASAFASSSSPICHTK